MTNSRNGMGGDAFFTEQVCLCAGKVVAPCHSHTKRALKDYPWVRGGFPSALFLYSRDSIYHLCKRSLGHMGNIILMHFSVAELSRATVCTQGP